MSLNPSSAFCASCDVTPDAKFSLNINAFNGNTTNFNRCPAPSSKSLPMPVQPRELPPSFSGTSIKTGGLVRPM
jgi:hypothetical protein